MVTSRVIRVQVVKRAGRLHRLPHQRGSDTLSGNLQLGRGAVRWFETPSEGVSSRDIIGRCKPPCGTALPTSGGQPQHRLLVVGYGGNAADGIIAANPSPPSI